MEKEAEKMTFGEKFKKHFTTTTLVLIPICAGINLIGGWLATTLKLFVFLDMIGTIVAAAIGGPWVAAVVGLLTNIFMAIVANPVYLPYALVSIGVGLLTGYMVQKGFFKSFGGYVITWLANTLLSVIISSAITILVFGGSTGATGGSALTAYLLATGQKIITSVVATSFLETLLDRAIAYFAAFIVLSRIPKKFISKVVSTSK